MKKPRVVVLQHRLLHYRVELFERMREECSALGIDFCLVHGQATKSELKKQDSASLEWAIPVNNSYARIGGLDILWQPFPREYRDADLVILMQESRLLSNYYWLLARGAIHARVAYWGHGRNFQANKPNNVRERWKRALLGRVDWWFAYTELTRQILLDSDYPEHRISVLNNAIDNDRFKSEIRSMTEQFLAATQHSLARNDTGLTSSVSPVGLFCGSLYPDKRIDFMIAAADRIRTKLPTFTLVVVGDGPSAPAVQLAAKTRPWLRVVGAQRGPDKAKWFAQAKVLFNPGAVGLHVLDSFCSGVPLLTTSDARHGPEIAYLENDVNGVIVEGGVAEYADAVIRLLSDPLRHSAMRKRALESAERYTLRNMILNFRAGIERCLSSPKKA